MYHGCIFFNCITMTTKYIVRNTCQYYLKLIMQICKNIYIDYLHLYPYSKHTINTSYFNILCLTLNFDHKLYSYDISWVCINTGKEKCKKECCTCCGKYSNYAVQTLVAIQNICRSWLISRKMLLFVSIDVDCGIRYDANLARF